MKILAIAGFVCAVGLGPALAQNIFLSPNTTSSSANDDKEKQGQIFLSPQQRLTDEARKPAIKYRDKLVVRAMKKNAIDKIKTLEEWEAAGMQPQNIEEQMMYAQAKRAVAQNVMYDRRQEVMARIEKRQRVVEARLASEAKAALKTAGSKGDTRIETIVETEEAEALAQENAPTMSKAQAAQLAAQEAADKRKTRSVQNSSSSWLKVFRKNDSSSNASGSGGEKKSRVFTNF